MHHCPPSDLKVSYRHYRADLISRFYQGLFQIRYHYHHHQSNYLTHPHHRHKHDISIISPWAGIKNHSVNYIKNNNHGIEKIERREPKNTVGTKKYHPGTQKKHSGTESTNLGTRNTHGPTCNGTPKITEYKETSPLRCLHQVQELHLHYRTELHIILVFNECINILDRQCLC